MAALLIAYYYPPVNVVASQRSAKFARALLGKYGKLYVITQDPTNLQSSYIDHQFNRDVVDHKDITVIFVKPILNKLSNSKNINRLHCFLNSMLTRIFCGALMDWVFPLYKQLNKLGSDIEFVLATAPPFSAFIGLNLWLSNRKLPSVFDYRDLWSQNPSFFPIISRWLVANLFEKRVFNSRRKFITVSEGCKSSLIQLGIDPKDINILHNFPDRHYVDYIRSLSYDDEEYVINRAFYNISYTGQHYKHASLHPVIQAISRIPLPFRNQIKFNYFGASGRVITNIFKSLGIESVLVNHGYTRKSLVLIAIQKSDLLVNVNGNELFCSSLAFSGILASKVFDYFLTGKDILNISPIDNEMHNLAKSIHYKNYYSFPAQNLESIYNFLIQKLTVYLTNGHVRTQVDASFIPDFITNFMQIHNNLFVKRV